MRGIVWGSILSLGALTKISFFYFIVLIVPTLFLIKVRIDGVRRACVAMAAFCCSSVPAVLYLALWGRPAFGNASASSFGEAADLYYLPVLEFLGNVIRESPGIVFSFLLTVSALIYLVIKRRTILARPDLFALLITVGFGIIVLASPNREIRFAFPVILALPFLTGILLSGNGQSALGRPAGLAAGLAFLGLLAAGVPTEYRPDRQSLIRPDAILAQAIGCNAKRVVLATDSPTLNAALMNLALEVSPSAGLVKVESLAGQASSGVPIERDFHVIDEGDQVVVFQDKEHLFPPFTNQRVAEYERHVRQAGYLPLRLMDDLSVYPMGCRP
jgi:hypothetical protein